MTSQNTDIDIVNEFHKLYYSNRGRTWSNTFWMEVPVEKVPLDLWIYQEIIYEIKPDIIIETGTGRGGSTLFLANMLDIINGNNDNKDGKVITIDVEIREGIERPKHNRISYLMGSSISYNIIRKIKEIINIHERERRRERIPENDNKENKDKNKILVILDSSHSRAYVLEEMVLYSEFVSVGSYLIVEDSNIGGNPIVFSSDPGPMEAINEFLKMDIDKKFMVDIDREKFYLTWNPRGYLKRIK